MAYPASESGDGPLRLDFDRRLKLEFHGSRITTDGLERFGSGGLAANQGKHHPKPSQTLPGATMVLLSFQKSGVIWAISVNSIQQAGKPER
jgi:hypothetical protein